MSSVSTPTRGSVSLAFALLLSGAQPALSQTTPAPAAVSFEPTGRPPLSITGGLVSGVKLTSGVNAYLGIPYAAPPVGPLRWKPPAAVLPWIGVRPAVQLAANCTQKARGPQQNFYFGADTASEDCLYVNVWAPASADRRSRLPVVVYIHGGGFSVGSGAQMWSCGEAMAGKGVIWVTLNYRLGALGFLAHPELTAEAAGRGSGNYGMMDQIAALRWVKRNIEAFGGDPANVTIMGQSAGSMAVSVLHASPEAAGLFHRAIGLSGSALSSQTGAVRSLAEAEENGVAFLNAKGVRSIEELRGMSADDVAGSPGMSFWPNVDGFVLPQTPNEIFAARRQNDAALLVGFTRDESFNAVSGAQSREQYEALVHATYPDQAADLLARYPANDDWQTHARQLGRDASLGVSMWKWADAQTQRRGKPAYTYMFSRVHPYTPGVQFLGFDAKTAGASHSSDIPYWLGTINVLNSFRQTRDFTAADRKLSQEMSDLVVAFARTGVPQTAAVPAVRFDPANARVVELDTSIRVIDWPGRENIGLLKSLPAPKQAPLPSVTPRM